MSVTQVRSYVSNSLDVIKTLGEQAQQLDAIITVLLSVLQNGGTIYTCGNGGSACEAMHLAEDLVARYERDRPGIKVQHLGDSGVITCWANDYSFDGVFARQVETFASSRDALLVLSTSGNSQNIIEALKAARGKGAKTIGLLGKSGGKALEYLDCSLVIPANKTAHIQEAHLVAIHIICQQLESSLFPQTGVA